jgi:hypothetical protein
MLGAGLHARHSAHPRRSRADDIERFLDGEIILVVISLYGRRSTA